MTPANLSDMSPLEERFPRILEKIVQHWGHPEFARFADHLIIDERGSRQGFPAEVLSDMLMLYQVHMEKSGVDPQEYLLPYASAPYQQ